MLVTIIGIGITGTIFIFASICHYERRYNLKYNPRLHPSWSGFVIDKIKEESITIDNFAEDNKIEKETLLKFIGCQLISYQTFFYLCGLLKLDWLEVQKQRNIQ